MARYRLRVIRVGGQFVKLGIRVLLRNLRARCAHVFSSACKCAECLQVVVGVVAEHRCHQRLSFGCCPPSSGARDFGDKVMGMQALQQASGLSTLAFQQDQVVVTVAEQITADILVLEPVNCMFTTEHCGKQGGVLLGRRIETTLGTTMSCGWLGQFFDGRTLCLHIN